MHPQGIFTAVVHCTYLHSLALKSEGTWKGITQTSLQTHKIKFIYCSILQKLWVLKKIIIGIHIDF